MPFNYSRLRHLFSCDLAFANYPKAAASKDFVAGTATHRAADCYLKRCLSLNVDRDLDSAKEIGRAAAMHVPDLKERESVEEMVEYLAATHSALPPPGWEAASERKVWMAVIEWKTGEIECRIMTPNKDGSANISIDGERDGTAWIVHGTVDFMWWRAGEAKVWDWKSDHSLSAGKNLNRDLQARIYALLAAVDCGADTVHVDWEYLRFGITRSATMDREALDAAAEELVSLLKRGSAVLADPKPKPTPGSQCATCSVFHLCTAAKEALQHFRTGDLTDPGEWLLLKRHVADYEDLLRERVAIEPVTVSEREEVRLVPQERREAKETAEVVEALHGLGYEDDEIIGQMATFSVTKLEKALKANGKRGAALEEAMKSLATESWVSVLKVVDTDKETR